MNDKEKKQITILGPVSGQTRTISKRDIIEGKVDVANVRDKLTEFLDSLKEIIDVDVPSVGAYELEQIQFSAEISANGEFKLLGTGVGLEAKSGVTFTLQRKKTELVRAEP